MATDRDTKWGLVVAALLLGVLALIIYAQKQLEAQCETKGGVYLIREGKCVSGIKELK
jgi:hypothetical protein